MEPDFKRLRLEMPVEEIGSVFKEIANGTELKENGTVSILEEDAPPVLSKIELLPEDVKYIIYRMAVDSLKEIKMTSKAMCQSVNEWATYQNLPPLDLRITATTLDLLGMEVIVPRSVFECFKCIRDIFSEGVLTKTYSWSKESVRLFSQVQLSQSAIESVRNHLPIKYRHVDILIQRVPRSMDRFRFEELFQDVKSIKQLKLELRNLNLCYRNLISSIIKIPIRRIKLKVRTVTYQTPREILLELASHVPEIEIRQEIDGSIPLRSDYLFGMVDADWAAITTAMFEKGAVRIHLINQNYSHITKEDIDMVRLFLSSSPSKHIFCTTIDYLQNTNLQVLEAETFMLRNYMLGRWKLFYSDRGFRPIHYLRYRHQDIHDDVIDEEETLVPYTLFEPRESDLLFLNVK